MKSNISLSNEIRDALLKSVRPKIKLYTNFRRLKNRNEKKNYLSEVKKVLNRKPSF